MTRGTGTLTVTHSRRCRCTDSPSQTQALWRAWETELIYCPSNLHVTHLATPPTVFSLSLLSLLSSDRLEERFLEENLRGLLYILILHSSRKLQDHENSVKMEIWYFSNSIPVVIMCPSFSSQYYNELYMAVHTQLGFEFHSSQLQLPIQLCTTPGVLISVAALTTSKPCTCHLRCRYTGDTMLSSTSFLKPFK